MAIAPLLVQFGNAEANYAAGSLPLSATVPGATSFVVPSQFPSSVFSSYYPQPSGQQPQPILHDPVLNITFPPELTNPDTIPEHDPDRVYFPAPLANLSHFDQQIIISNVVVQVKDIISSPYFANDCSKCVAALAAAKPAAQYAPKLVPDAIVNLCNDTQLHSSTDCKERFATDTAGTVWTQILALANVTGLDGQYICNSIGSFCPFPTTSPLNITGLFPKPRPKDVIVAEPSGKRVKVLHLSDFHLDPRYKTGSEANCSAGLCCRNNAQNSNLPNGSLSFPAPEYGYFKCDTPYDLGLAALQAVGPLTGTSKSQPLAWTLYTGDLVSHDSQSELSKAYTEYAEVSIFEYLFKQYLTGPVFATLGNHDTSPKDVNSPHTLPGPLGEQQSWNYEHVSKLWKHEGWLDDEAARQAKTHYGAYSIKNHFGLRLITLNSDFWYKGNFFNFINSTNPDNSGMLQFVIDELQAAEDSGERVWIFAHVLSGRDGSNPLPGPTDLFYQIVDRYSPHVIANIFFGHTHEDQVMIYYTNNGTDRSRNTALTSGWIGPSVTPLTNLNSGFRMYEVDTGNFEIYEAYTWYSNVSDFSALTTHGPVFEFEYSTRDMYGQAVDWPAAAPLNATFWHAVTEAMEEDHSLVSKFIQLQGKMSVLSPNCTNAACAEAQICYIRSGSVALGKQCPQGYGSVQSPFTPEIPKTAD